MSDTEGEQKELSKIDQAAVLLMSLGEAEAAAILRNMGPKEVQAIGMSMTQLADVNHTQVHSAVGNMLTEVSGQTSLGVDSDQYIRNVMVKALGEDKANTLVDKIMLGGNSTGLETLRWMDAKTVAEVIRHEHPQIQAIVITYLDPEQSAAVLEILSDEARLEIITRVATLESVHP